MIVVKLGGSLNRDPLLRDWLQLLSTAGRGRVVIVPGGGGFADQVREHQALWHFDDLAAHNMAILAMMQTGTLFRGLAPGLQPARSSADIARVLHCDEVAVWCPADWIRSQADDMTHWGATSDSLAAWLASLIGATLLVLVKAADPGKEPATAARMVVRASGEFPTVAGTATEAPPFAGAATGHPTSLCASEAGGRDAVLARHAENGMIDAEFCRLTATAPYAIELLGKRELLRMRALLRTAPTGGRGTAY